MRPLPVFIGWDDREAVAYHVFCNSLIRRASRPIQIIPLDQKQLRTAGLYSRPADEPASTAFAFSRFLAPLMGGTGYAVFADCDMLMLADIHELIEQIGDSKPTHERVWVAQHDYAPKTTLKMDGQQQVSYPRKNWSSVMVFDAARCARALTADYVNSATGQQLHRFQWVREDEIGAFPLEWNWLVGEYEPRSVSELKLLHYTLGGPWFPQTVDCDYAAEWLAEYQLMTGRSFF